MIKSLEKLTTLFLNPSLSRRDFLRLVSVAGPLFLVLPGSTGESAEEVPRCGSIVEEFLGEELFYHIGFWLFTHCGEARMTLLETEQEGIYRGTLEGRTVGFVDWFLGQYRYAYVSYMEALPGGKRLRPLQFELTKNHGGRVSRLKAIFNYSGREIAFSQSMPDGGSKDERVPMVEGLPCEDYLTLFYNFRYGCYGPLARGRTYRLPLQVHKETSTLALTIVSAEEEERQRQREPQKVGKDFFLRFQVSQEDVSSKSGEIQGWLSREGIPSKGTIKDVVLLGDLWGDLVERKFRSPPR